MDVQKVTVRVPATSANCGPGFDCLGLACSLYNVFTFERIPQGIEVSGVGEGAEILPLGRHNLAVSSFYALWEKYQGKETGIRVTSVIHVPVSRGLGSSSTAVVAGLMAANAMLGSPLTKKELVTEATLIEGHPDNVAPAILGGITINIMADDKVKSLRFLPACPLGMIVLVPALHVSTEEARKVLPKEIPHKDAVYSASRAAMLVGSLITGQFENLPEALEDKLHTPYRLPLIPGASEALKGARDAGAYNAVISGSGSTLMAYVPEEKDRSRIAEALAAPFRKLGIACTLHQVSIDTEGAVVSLAEEAERF